VGSKTSLMVVMSPRVWGYTKVKVFYGRVRITEDQDIVIAGELFTDGQGNIWEFVSRKDDTINAYPVEL
jgi:hypothetical protein